MRAEVMEIGEQLELRPVIGEHAKENPRRLGAPELEHEARESGEIEATLAERDMHSVLARAKMDEAAFANREGWDVVARVLIAHPAREIPRIIRPDPTSTVDQNAAAHTRLQAPMRKVLRAGV